MALITIEYIWSLSMNNPNDFLINTDFASSGNDNSSIITVVVPAHTLIAENTYTNTVTSTSKWAGKQIRAQITITTLAGAKRVPCGACHAQINSGGYQDPLFYVYMDVSRITDNTIRLRVTTENQTFGLPSMSVPSFTVEARVRTIIGN